MKARAERFIVVHAADKENWGYNEETLPILLTLVDSFGPDQRFFSHTGVVGYFRTSSQKVGVVKSMVGQLETLQSSDERFSYLGIGVAEGELIGKFNWFGRLVGRESLFGSANNEAARNLQIPGAFTESLNEIERRLEP